MGKRIPLNSGNKVKLSNDTYIITRLISKGGTSLIYEAERLYCDSSNGSDYVCFNKKVLLKELAPFNLDFVRVSDGQMIFDKRDIEDVRRLFENEINSLAYIQSNNDGNNRIPDMDAFGEYNNTMYIAMNHIKGELLSDFISEKKHNNHEILNIFLQMLDIVEFLHGIDEKYCHLDLKPTNFLIDSINTVFLFDFGSSLIEKDKWVRNYTEDYSAPEVIYNMMDSVDQRADIYSLGAILYELVSGEQASLEKFLLCGDNYCVNKEVDLIDYNSFLKKMLTEDVSARYNSVSEIKRELDALISLK